MVDTQIRVEPFGRDRECPTETVNDGARYVDLEESQAPSQTSFPQNGG